MCSTSRGRGCGRLLRDPELISSTPELYGSLWSVRELDGKPISQLIRRIVAPSEAFEEVEEIVAELGLDTIEVIRLEDLGKARTPE